MTNTSPTQASEREIFMDVLRGFAILGIFIANLGTGFSWYDENAPVTSEFLKPAWDTPMLFVHHWLIEGKFYSIFSLLFGWGIALQIKRGMDKGSEDISLIYRRLVFMLILGFCHLLIWTGDIVFFYALLGFVLLPLRRFSDKTLLITAVILLLSPILLYGLKMLLPILNKPALWLNDAGNTMQLKLFPEFADLTSYVDYFNAIKQFNWWDIVKLNVAGIFYRFGYLLFVSRIPKVLGMFIIGYLIGKTDFYKNIARHKTTIIVTILLGLIIGLRANFILAKYMLLAEGDYFSFKVKGLYQTIAYAIGVAPLALAYVGIFMLAFQYQTSNKIMSILAPVGKMAFSNYIMQSLVGNFVFLGAGLGLMGQIGPFYYTLFGIGFFIIQILYSTLWLRYFNYGPVEWLWRSATYNKWQTMVRN